MYSTGLILLSIKYVCLSSNQQRVSTSSLTPRSQLLTLQKLPSLFLLDFNYHHYRRLTLI